MSVNTSRIDEEQKEVLKKDTLIRLFKYLLVYKKQISVVLLIMAGTIAIKMCIRDSLLRMGKRPLRRLFRGFLYALRI